MKEFADFLEAVTNRRAESLAPPEQARIDESEQAPELVKVSPPRDRRSRRAHSGPSPPRLGQASTRVAARRRSAERSRRRRTRPALTIRPPCPGRKCGPPGPAGRTTRTTLRPPPCGDSRMIGLGSSSVAAASSISSVSIRIGSAGAGRRVSAASRARADFGMAMPAPDRIADVSTALASTTTTRQRPGVSISMKAPAPAARRPARRPYPASGRRTPGDGRREPAACRRHGAGASAAWERARRKPEASDDSTRNAPDCTNSRPCGG